jgi:hypothetical protein
MGEEEGDGAFIIRWTVEQCKGDGDPRANHAARVAPTSSSTYSYYSLCPKKNVIIGILGQIIKEVK